eukprot:TRINITY_DN75302_c0_g1_i1.p1 TRINITY_DN75302_c0_g1~~TRINITY_DN75302_c0_g1_i1.p1  ORF type:complete len:201 (+),score=45.12 TRINITY_DN75302_c0_g1_i1:82-603(+)
MAAEPAAAPASEAAAADGADAPVAGEPGGTSAETEGSVAQAVPGASSDAADAPAGPDEEVHSVVVTIPSGFEGLPIDLIIDDQAQARIHDITRRSVGAEAFRRNWPAGRRAMLDSMLRGLEEAGRGSVVQGLRRVPAEALVAQLTELVTAEVLVDREGAAALSAELSRMRFFH